MSFQVFNSATSGQLTYPVLSGTYTPTLSSPNSPGQIQFTNFNVLSAFYSQINDVISLNVRFTANASAPGGESSGVINVTPPVYNIKSNNSIVGAITTISQVGLFGNLAASGNTVIVNMVNAAGPINVVNGVFQIISSYQVIEN